MSDFQFSTPLEYLRYVQASFAVPESEGTPDAELVDLLKERAATAGIPEHDVSSSSYRLAIDPLATMVTAGCQARHGIDLAASCAFGPLESQSVNARCFRSEEGHYAIVLHHGLMNLLHKRSKLLTAAVKPTSVVYCNRAAPSHLTPQKLLVWADELGDIYRATGETKGAIVMLDSDAASVAALAVTLGEAFVLGHEAGHVIAGHLEDPSRLISDDEVPSLWFFPETQAHADEFEADRYGFEAMENIFESIPKGLLLSALVSTFQALDLIGAGERSDSHPGVTERIHGIVESHFSIETARLVHRWIDNGDHEAASRVLRETA